MCLKLTGYVVRGSALWILSLWPIPDFAVGLHWAPGETRRATLRPNNFGDYPPSLQRDGSRLRQQQPITSKKG